MLDNDCQTRNNPSLYKWNNLLTPTLPTSSFIRAFVITAKDSNASCRTTQQTCHIAKECSVTGYWLNHSITNSINITHTLGNI